MSKATDTRPPFFLIEDAIFNYGLTPYEGWVYAAIVKHADRQTGVAFPGTSKLAELCQMSTKQVSRSIKTLEEKGIIDVNRDEKPEKGERRKRDVNHYIIKPISGSRDYQSVPVGTTSLYPTDHQSVGVGTTRPLNQSQVEPESTNQRNTFAAPCVAAGAPIQLKAASPKPAIHGTWVGESPVGEAPAAASVQKPTPSAAQPPPEPKAPRPRNLMYDAVKEFVFEYDPKDTPKDKDGQEVPDGLIGAIAAWLNGTSDRMKTRGKGKDIVVGFISRPATPEHVEMFAIDWKAKPGSPSMPTGFESFIRNWRSWAVEKSSSMKPTGSWSLTPVTGGPLRNAKGFSQEELDAAKARAKSGVLS